MRKSLCSFAAVAVIAAGCGSSGTDGFPSDSDAGAADPGNPGPTRGTVDGGGRSSTGGSSTGGSSTGGRSTGGSSTGGSSTGGSSTGGSSTGGSSTGGASTGGTTGTSGGGAVGDPCTADADCAGGANATCVPHPDWPNGYCVILDCANTPCPTGSECFDVGNNTTACLDSCTQKSDCRAEYTCDDGAQACVPSCTSDADCDTGNRCNTTTGQCVAGATDAGPPPVVDAGSNAPPVGPGPNCPNVPAKDCTGTAAYCGEIIPFNPPQGPGYDNYPINGETAANQYRSFARRDLVMLIKWAAAYTACKTAGWQGGNNQPLAPGDMSEANGAIPGTSIGQPGHPAGTHVNGFDMDIGYYQNAGPNNYLRPICNHMQNGQDQYHCVAPPNLLDTYRQAFILGSLFTSNRTRVIGVDGQAGVVLQSAMNTLCQRNWLPQSACTASQNGLAYEVTDTGRGWYQFHHHHFHISLKPAASGGGNVRAMSPLAPSSPWMTTLSPEGLDLGRSLELLNRTHVPGETFLGE